MNPDGADPRDPASSEDTSGEGTSQHGGRGPMPGERAFAQEFAEALAVGGVSMSALRDRLSRRGLSISLATLSYWRTGVVRDGIYLRILGI